MAHAIAALYRNLECTLLTAHERRGKIIFKIKLDISWSSQYPSPVLTINPALIYHSQKNIYEKEKQKPGFIDTIYFTNTCCLQLS
jgi:hypothetical protein